MATYTYSMRLVAPVVEDTSALSALDRFVLSELLNAEAAREERGGLELPMSFPRAYVGDNRTELGVQAEQIARELVRLSGEERNFTLLGEEDWIKINDYIHLILGLGNTGAGGNDPWITQPVAYKGQMYTGRIHLLITTTS